MNYPSIGWYDRWFDCVVGTRNTDRNRAHFLFSNPYTDPKEEKAMFFMKEGASLPAGVVKVGGKKNYEITRWLKMRMGGRRSAEMQAADEEGQDPETIAFVQDLISRAEGQVEVREYEKNAQFDDAGDVMLDALMKGEIDLILYGATESSVFYPTIKNSALAGLGAVKVAATQVGWAIGHGYRCHWSQGDLVKKLNEGLAAVKSGSHAEYNALCAKYDAEVHCNFPTYDIPDTQKGRHKDYYEQDVDAVIAVDGDSKPYSFADSTTALDPDSFDLQLTNLACSRAGLRCAVIPFPGTSIMVSGSSYYEKKGWGYHPVNFPAIGFNKGWFDAASSIRVTDNAQFAWLDPVTPSYSDPRKDVAGILTLSDRQPGSGAKLGVKSGYAIAHVIQDRFKASPGKDDHAARLAQAFGSDFGGVEEFATDRELAEKLASGEVAGVFHAKGDAQMLEELLQEMGKTVAWMEGHDLKDWNRGLVYAVHWKRPALRSALQEQLSALQGSSELQGLCGQQGGKVPC